MLKKIATLTLFLLLIAAAAGAVLWRDFERFRAAPLVPEGQAVLWLAPGTSYTGFVRELERLGLTRRDWRWYLLGRLDEPRLRAGEYELAAGMSPRALIDHLERGRVRLHSFTIVEGWVFAQLRRALSDDPRWTREAAGLDDETLMARLGCGGCVPEGRFLPETYLFPRGASDMDILRRAYRSMEDALEEAWSGRAPDVPLNDPDELLVLASIVEKETGVPDERARVSGVFARRLRRGMRLQTDPTVIYGLGEDYNGRLTYANLRTDHPWNTYTRGGLPPTPIALPGRPSLEAAARPEPGTALYFVARGDGSHYFSDTLAEHNAAVNRYIRNRGSN